MLFGSCHCGAVRLQVARKPRTLTECNCSICHRYGVRWAYYARQSVRIEHAVNGVTAYRWGSKTIEYYHCNRCGCVTHYHNVNQASGGRMAVNARMLRPSDLKGARIRLLDGASTWKYLS